MKAMLCKTFRLFRVAQILLKLARASLLLVAMLVAMLFVSTSSAYVSIADLYENVCAKIVAGNTKYDHQLAKFKLWVSKNGATVIKDEQAFQFQTHLSRVLAGWELSDNLSRGPLYPYTGEQKVRQTEWTDKAQRELEATTGWTEPFGVSYNSSRNISRVLAIGDKRRIKAINLKLFKQSTDDSPFKTIAMNHSPSINDGLAWVVELPDDIEGLWYHFEYITQPGAVSDLNETIPDVFIGLDPTAQQTSDHMARVYYPPAVDKSEKKQKLGANSESAPIITLEFNLRDLLNPKKSASTPVPPAIELQQDSFIQKLMAPFTHIELLPVRPYMDLDTFKDDEIPNEASALYFHYWGYMPTTHGIASNLGGPDAIVALVQFMKKLGKGLIKDEVIQHTANKPPGSFPALNVFHYAMVGVYRTDNCDRTGCGNTTNMDWNNSYTKLVTQMIIHDLLIIGWSGHRYDLMGAIPRDTVKQFVALAKRHGAHATGEPYGVPFDNSFWSTAYKLVFKAKVWDHIFREKFRALISEQSTFSSLVNWMAGGSLFTWPNSSEDRTVIVETHDGPTLVNYFDGDLRRSLFATSLELFSQGDITLALSQILGINHSHLDNTPLDLTQLEPKQKEYLEKVLNIVKVRKQLNAFFAHPYLDVNDPSNYVELSEQGYNSGYIWLKQPAYEDPDIPQGQEVTLVLNNSDNSTLPDPSRGKEIHLPPGDWYFALEGNPRFLQVVKDKIFLKPYEAVWLVRKK